MKTKSYISPRLELIEIELEEVMTNSPGDDYMGEGNDNNLGKQQTPVMEKADYRTSLGGSLSL